MSDNESSHKTLKYYSVWDRTTRWFHWINVICIIGLIGVGTTILNHKILGVSSDGKLLLKTVHVYIGYVFVLNLMWRLLWGFIGNKYVRWKMILPIGKAYWRSVSEYIAGAKTGQPPPYLGHNPIAKLMVALLFVLLTTQATTGLVLAGTDLYLPPFGHEIAEWVTGSGEEHERIKNLKPGSKENVDSDAYAEMRQFRKPFITTHVYSFYALLIAIILHIAAVVVAEVREKNGLVSAMFTGKKVLSKKPLDLD
ncbi:MAG: cytochrome b/b6 domain-containing protein [Gammaproteobacteria bacterium]|nr:cytochrome b/b6 domain-containing protein [Gammaproteobacteria bacterium]